jgi:glycosyltransferase involved in cell wall biosynthesis
VIDSGSTDETRQIVSRFPQTEFIYRPFDSFAEQCNFGLSQIRTKWVLSLDADYELSDELVQELHNLSDESSAGYRVGFVYRIHGHPLRGAVYPSRTVLYRAKHAKYENYGHGHKIVISGTTRLLRGVIYHDDRKSLSRWLQSQQVYAGREAHYLLNAKSKELSRTARIRLLGWPAVLLMPLYVLFVKGCIFDGWPGCRYTLERLLAETLIALEILDRRLFRASERNRGDGSNADASAHLDIDVSHKS